MSDSPLTLFRHGTDPTAAHARLLAHLLARMTLNGNLPPIALCTSRDTLLQGLGPLLERSARFVASGASAWGAVEFDTEMWPVSEAVQAVPLRAEIAEPNWDWPAQHTLANELGELSAARAALAKMRVALRLAQEEAQELRRSLMAEAQRGEDITSSKRSVDAASESAEKDLTSGDVADALRDTVKNTGSLAAEAREIIDIALAPPAIPLTIASLESLPNVDNSPVVPEGPHEKLPTNPLKESPLGSLLSDSASHIKLYQRENSIEIVEYEVCTTSSSILVAVGVLRRCPYILVGCEGLSVGIEGGVLSIISLGTPFFTVDSAGALTFPPLCAPSNTSNTAQRIYLIDALSLDESTRSALKFLLSADYITKIVWDGRSDDIELRAALGVGVTARVLDLQIVEVCGRRTVRGEKGSRSRARINERANSVNGPVVSKKTRALFAEMHVVLDMDACVKEYIPSADVHKDGALLPLSLRVYSNCRQWHTERVTKQIFEKNAERVLERPAPDILLDYAATDVRMLAHLARCFSTLGYISADPTGLDTLFALSQRHVSRNGLMAREKPQPYRVVWLMLLGALTAPLDECRLVCGTCNARLPVNAFERQGAMRRKQCRLCVVGPLVRPALIGKIGKTGAGTMPKTWVVTT
jgi:hypothetical protein